MKQKRFEPLNHRGPSDRLLDAYKKAPVVYVAIQCTLYVLRVLVQLHNIMYMYGTDQYCCIDDCETV